MNDWKESNIKSLGTVFTNNTFSRDCLNYDSGEYQNIHYGDVLITFSDVIDANSPLVPYINSNETVKSDTFIEDGDIIVADTAEDETVGKVCEIQNVGKRKIVSGLHTLWYRPNKNEFAPKYLGYLLNTFECHKQLVRKAHGIKVLSINKGDFWKTIIKYPASLNEQNAIAGIISKVDQCIENTQKTIDATQKLKKSLMQNLLTGRMKPDGTMRKDNEFYEHPKLGKVPIGWEIKKGFNITDKITKGQSPKWQGFEYQKKGILFITSENIQNGFIDFSNPKYLPLEFHQKIINSKILNGDVLINIVGASSGRCALFYSDEIEVNTNQAVCILRFKKEYSNRFNCYYLQLETTLNRLFRNQVETARTNLSLGDFKKFLFLLPPKNEAELISDKLDKIVESIKTRKAKIKVLKNLKKSLMQNLLTGKKRVDVEKINNLLESMK